MGHKSGYRKSPKCHSLEQGRVAAGVPLLWGPWYVCHLGHLIKLKCSEPLLRKPSTTAHSQIVKLPICKNACFFCFVFYMTTTNLFYFV